MVKEKSVSVPMKLIFRVEDPLTLAAVVLHDCVLRTAFGMVWMSDVESFFVFLFFFQNIFELSLLGVTKSLALFIKKLRFLILQSLQ